MNFAQEFLRHEFSVYQQQWPTHHDETLVFNSIIQSKCSVECARKKRMRSVFSGSYTQHAKDTRHQKQRT